MVILNRKEDEIDAIYLINQSKGVDRIITAEDFDWLDTVDELHQVFKAASQS